MKYCNIKLDKLNLEQAKEKINYFLSNPGQYKIFTPNPEFVVLAQKDNNFCETLNKSDLNICDGFGLSLFSGCPRIPGVDFMLEICKIAANKNNGIYLLGSGSDEIVQMTGKKLQEKFVELEISGYNKGINIDYKLNYNQEENYNLIEKINNSKAKILFVAFGMNKQERWISENLAKMPNIKIAMGVGGSFDYISGLIHRAPCFLRKIGLEWLYRLVKQPKRLENF